MRRSILSLAVFAWLLIDADIARAVENPEYLSWAKYKVGTSATMVLTVDGEKGKTETKYTLIEITPAKCVIEFAGRMETDGKTFDLPVQTMDVPHDIDPRQLPEANNQGNPKTSDQDVTVGAGKFKAKLTETSFESNGTKTTMRIWRSNDAPGITVKMESIMDGMTKSRTVTELTKIEKK